MTWLAPHDGKPGRPAVLSDAAIQFCLTIKVLFKLPLRQTTGMVASLLKLVNHQRPVDEDGAKQKKPSTFVEGKFEAHDPKVRTSSESQ